MSGRAQPASSVLAAVLALAVLAGACSSDSAPDSASELDEFGCAIPEAPAPELLEVGVVFEHRDNGNDHEGCPSGYDVAVPTSGTHFAVGQNCGFYTVPVRDQSAVQSLEHGAVWIAYDPDLTADEVGAIEAAVAVETHLLAAPYPGLQNAIVLSAWTRQLAVDKWVDPLVEHFLGEFLGSVSTIAPESGGSCADGLGIAPDRPDSGYGPALESVDGR